jgi:NAD(P)-dependent dehydrogenase (short-subunit alcohol dehydrogenase family)
MRDAVEFTQRTNARGQGKAVLVYPAERMNNITANALAPGLTLSDQILKNDDHMAKFGEAIRKSRSIQRDALPADLVGTVSFLASDDAAFMTGQTLCVEGGAIFV